MVPVRLLLYVCDLCHQWSVRPPAPPSHFGNMIPTTHCLLSASSTQVQNLQGNCQTPQPAPLFRAGLRSRNAHGHVIRAILCGNLPGNCQTAPAGPLFHAGLRDRKCTWTCHKSHFMQKFKGKLPDAPASALVSCGPAQSKCTWTCHKSRFMRKFTRKLSNGPSRGPCFVRSRNAHGHVTRAILCGN